MHERKCLLGILKKLLNHMEQTIIHLVATLVILLHILKQTYIAHFAEIQKMYNFGK